jgi:hypothetical protein
VLQANPERRKLSISGRACIGQIFVVEFYRYPWYYNGCASFFACSYKEMTFSFAFGQYNINKSASLSYEGVEFG